MLRKIWNDPVWSKIISVAIIAAVGLVVSQIQAPGGLAIGVATAIASAAVLVAIGLLIHKLIRWLRDPIDWEFSGYFLGMNAASGKDIHVSSFQAQGYNKTGRHIRRVSGYLKSDITGEQTPLLLESMPPEETNGIPPKCKFWIRALFRDPAASREGIPAEAFLRRFSSFIFVIVTDDKEYHHKFSRKVVQNQISSFWRDSNPTPAPAIAKRTE